MRARGPETALRALSLIYVMSASAFSLTIALTTSAPWAEGFQHTVRLTVPHVMAAAATVRDTAAAAKEKAIMPALAWAEEKDKTLFDWIAAQRLRVAAVPQPAMKAPVRVAAKVPVSKQRASLPAPVAAKQPMELAQQEPLQPAPDANPPSPQELSRVMAHLKVSLTKELYQNFSLFLYVSKADRGPWSQRMFVFQKQDGGDLKLAYSFPVSTGAEIPKLGPSGTMLATNTPPGYYQLDPDRMYRRYHSMEWDQAMPYAMFFSWEHDGLQTGLAIHAATGADIGDLGKRASAGCVRLDPQNARLLFNLIKKNYKGLAPRFAYDRRTATMANDGLLMHDKAGNLEYADGYKVLVLIENDGGDNIVAALF